MKTIGIIILLCLPGFGVRAQVELNLQQCRQMALDNGKQLQIAGKAKEKAEYEKRAYFANYFPQLSGTGFYLYNQKRYSYDLKGGYLPTYVPDANGQLQPNLKLDAANNPVMGADGKPVFNEYAFLPDIDFQIGLRGVYSAGMQLQQPLFMGGKVRAAYRMSKIGEDLAGENVRLSRTETVMETDKAYWQLLRVQEQLVAARAYEAVLQELLKNLNDAYVVGMITQNDVLKTKVRYNDAGLMVQKAQNGLVLSRMNLCRLVGFNLQTEIHINDSLSGQLSPDIFTTEDGIGQRPDYSMLAKEVELKEKQIALSRADFLPQLGLTAGYGYSGGLSLNGTSEANASFTAMAAVGIPLFHWGEGRNKVRSARMDEEMSRLQLEKMSELMQLEVAAARLNIKDAVSRINMTHNALLQASENLRISKDQYDVGMESIANLLEAQAQWQESWAQWIDAKTMLRLNETEYLKSIGKLE